MEAAKAALRKRETPKDGMMVSRPTPETSAETRPFWEAARKHELLLPKCRHCGLFHYPPSPRCPQCLDANLIWTALSGEARLVSWTEVHLPTIPGVEPPFTTAEVELVEQRGLILVALIANVSASELKIGGAVKIGFVEDVNGFSYPEINRVGELL